MKSWHNTSEILENSNFKAQRTETQGRYCREPLKYTGSYDFTRSLKFTLPCCFTDGTPSKFHHTLTKLLPKISVWIPPFQLLRKTKLFLKHLKKMLLHNLGTSHGLRAITLPIGCNSLWCPSAYLCLSNDKTQFHRCKNGKGHIFLFFPLSPFLSTDKLGLYFPDKLRNLFSIFIQKMAMLQRDKQLTGTPANGEQPEPWQSLLWAATEDKPGTWPEPGETTKVGFDFTNRTIIWPGLSFFTYLGLNIIHTTLITTFDFLS